MYHYGEDLVEEAVEEVAARELLLADAAVDLQVLEVVVDESVVEELACARVRSRVVPCRAVLRV